MDYHIQQLEKKSISVIREAKAKFKNVAILWAMDKDSTLLLALCRRAFFGRIPFPVIYLDNGHDLPETRAFQKKIAKEWGMNLLVANIKELNKAEALKKISDDNKLDALIVSTKKDEKDDFYVRICPLSGWTEIDVWIYTREKNLPFNPLYLVQNGKKYQSIDDIIKELKITPSAEGRAPAADAEKEELMQRLRELGYLK